MREFAFKMSIFSEISIKHTAIGFTDSPKVVNIRHPECVTHASSRIGIAWSMTRAWILTNGTANVWDRHSNDATATPQFIWFDEGKNGKKEMECEFYIWDQTFSALPFNITSTTKPLNILFSLAPVCNEMTMNQHLYLIDSSTQNTLTTCST